MQTWSVKNAPKSGGSQFASSPRIVKKLKQIVKSDSRYTSQQIADMVGTSFCEIF